MVSKAKEIEVNGFKWLYQEYRNPDGNLGAINIYDGEGNFVTELKNHEEMIRFLSDVIDCGKGAVILTTTDATNVQ